MVNKVHRSDSQDDRQYMLNMLLNYHSCKLGMNICLHSLLRQWFQVHSMIYELTPPVCAWSFEMARVDTDERRDYKFPVD